MKSLKLIKMNIIYGIVIIFIALLISFFYVEDQYTAKSEHNFIDAIDKEATTLIKLKSRLTFDIAKSLAGNKKIIEVMKNKKFNKLYDTNFFPLKIQLKAFDNLALHIIDEKGINRYLSWTKNSIGTYILDVRKEIKKLYENPRQLMTISVGKFDITFKGIVPIYDDDNKFLGVVESITHFNSISKNLLTQNIYTATIIDKRFTKQLKYPFSKKFIDGYNISTLDLDKNIEKLLYKKGINYFTTLEDYAYLPKGNNLIDGYYVLNIPIKDSANNTIGSFLLFAEDINKLRVLLIIIKGVILVLTILFFIMSYFVYNEYKKNKKLIKNLNKRVKLETDKNLELIYHDNLTHCYSKERFSIDKGKYHSYDIVMLNIRNFSQINETYGFKVGDKVLKAVATRLKDILNVKIYRIDADEFLFSSQDIQNDLDDIRNNFMANSVYIEDKNINIRLSFCFSAVAGNASELLRKLTMALKQAKKEPYKSYIYYTEQEVQNDFIQFNSYLYDAIFLQKESEIIPYYQGIKDNYSGKIIKYEALARLRVKEKIYSPYFFIDVAKNSGYLYEITKIMIDKTFSFLSTQDKNILLSINITEDDLLSQNLKRYLVDKLDQYNINANRITLEILEGISSTGTKNNIKQLKELKELGFKLAIDDFGVEYSNFERINELDIDFIKIDGVYIKNIDKNDKSYKIAKAIAEFSSSMGIEVIAEFVENKEIQDIVLDLGINYSQGYFFSQPSEKLIDN